MAADNDPKTSHHSDDDSDDVAHPCLLYTSPSPRDS